MTKLPPEIERALELGWSIIPLRADKRPAIKSWKRYQTERPTREQVEQWHAELQPPAWAVITGAISGVVVLDGDGEDGTRTLAELAGPKRPAHVHTASDGRHLYCKHPGEHVPTLNSKKCAPLKKYFPGMDIRGDGGYAAFCGTVERKQGGKGSYRWQRAYDAQPLPASVLFWIREYSKSNPPAAPEPEPDAKPSWETAERIITNGRAESAWLLKEALKKVAQGNGRNNSGFWLAVQLRDNRYTETEAAAVLESYAAQVPITNPEGRRDPYREAEWRASLRQAYRSAARPPIERGYGRSSPPAAGLSPAETGAASDSAAALPHHAAVPLPEPPALVPDSEQEPPAAPPSSGWKCDDIGNAERFAHRYGRDVRYCAQVERWYCWDGKRYAEDKTKAVTELAKRTARAIWHEVGAALTESKEKELRRHAYKSASRGSLSAMLELAQSMPGIAIRPEELDADPWLFCCANGTLDLRTAELRPHRRHTLITKISPAKYDPRAECPYWMEFLRLIMGADEDEDRAERMIAFLQRAAGYCLTGDNSERVLFVPWGSGQNGKTTFLETIARIAGDYAMKAPRETIMAKRENGPTNDIARLKGARFVYTSETQEGGRLDEEKVKDLTGEETIVARFLYAEHFEFRREFKLWLGTNHRPKIQGADEGIWDRVKLIPFVVRIPDDRKQDRRIVNERLKAEWPGILRWCVDGVRDYLVRGLGVPPEVTEATTEYRAEMDILARFLADRAITGPGLTVPAGALYEAYRQWAQAGGERHPLTQTALGLRLTERHFEKKRDSSGRTVYTGIALRTDHTPPPAKEEEEAPWFV